MHSDVGTSFGNLLLLTLIFNVREIRDIRLNSAVVSFCSVSEERWLSYILSTKNATDHI